MFSSLVEQLRCPGCGSAVVVEMRHPDDGPEIHNGILRCSCYRYPIIDSIAVLRQRSAPDGTNDAAVSLLEKGDFAGALNHALTSLTPIPRPSPSRSEKLKFLFTHSRTLDKLDFTFEQALHFYRPSAYANYLYQRYANNSFLAAIPLLLLVRQANPAGRLLDLNCGVGHASFFLQTMFPQLSVFSTDHDYVNLHLVRRYIAPRATCLCLDAELPLPFADGFFDTALCMDGLHYIRSKKACLKELDRILKPDGLWLFPHMHNAEASNISPGIPLRAADYQRCFGFLEHRLLAEPQIFRTFMQRQVLDLRAGATPEALAASAAFSLVATRRPGFWREFDGGTPLLGELSSLGLNPIYQAAPRPDGSASLAMHWPSPALETECQAVKEFLPDLRQLPADIYTGLTNNSLKECDPAAIARLVHSFVLVHLPEGYIRRF